MTRMTTYRIIGNIVLHKAGMIVMDEACFMVDRGVAVLEIGGTAVRRRCWPVDGKRTGSTPNGKR